MQSKRPSTCLVSVHIFGRRARAEEEHMLVPASRTANKTVFELRVPSHMAVQWKRFGLRSHQLSKGP